MAYRSPARYLAPVALVVFAVAVLLVVNQASSGDTGGSKTTTGASTTKSGGTTKKARKAKRFYRVKPGDTLSSIAEKFGITVDDLLGLNPDLDPNTVRPGQRIRLRQ